MMRHYNWDVFLRAKNIFTEKQVQLCVYITFLHLLEEKSLNYPKYGEKKPHLLYFARQQH